MEDFHFEWRFSLIIHWKVCTLDLRTPEWPNCFMNLAGGLGKWSVHQADSFRTQLCVYSAAGMFHLTSLEAESCQPGVWQSHYRSRRHQRRTSCSKGSLFQHQWHFPGRNWKVKWIGEKGNLPLCEQCYEAGSYSHGSLEFSVHPMSVTKGVLELNHLCTLHGTMLWFSRVKYGWWVGQPSIPREA